MQTLNIVVLALVFLSVTCLEPPEPFSAKCRIGPQRRTVNTSVPWFDIDLNESTFLRWRKVGNTYKSEMKELVQTMKSIIIGWFGSSFLHRVENDLGYITDLMPENYADELRGMSNASGIPLSEVVLYNIFYEVFSVCTSIVAQDPKGSLYHGRNMDFGLLLGWDRQNHDWLVAEQLRRLVINVNFMKNGFLVYKAVTFAGYIGTFTAMKPNAFALTINERFIADGGYVGLFEWFAGIHNASWVTWMVRDLFESVNNYETAANILSNTPVIAPFYGIISGTASGQGQIVVRSRKAADGVIKLNPGQPDGWFLLQTNTDPWEQPFFLDDRRTPGQRCIRKLGQQNLSLTGLVQVLSSPTTLNKLTVFSTVIKTDKNVLETYIQKCPDPCWPW